MRNPVVRLVTVGAFFFGFVSVGDARADETPPLAVAADTECRGDALGAVIRKVERGSVNVRTHVTIGSGFAVAGGLIVTDFDLVRRPQGLRIVGPDGVEMEATIVAVDEDHRIAVLRPEGALTVTPVELAERPAKLGEEVVLVGVSDFAQTPLGAPLVRRAIVTADGERFALDVQTWPHAGAPIMSCSGAVVGLAATSGAKAVRSVTAALARAATAEEYEEPAVDLGSIEAGLIVQGAKDDDPFLGGQVGLGVLFFDRLDLSARVGVLAGVTEPGEDVSAVRVSGDLRLGYRANISTMPWPMWLVPSAGAAFMYNWRSETQSAYSIENSSCITEGRTCELDVEETVIESESVVPMVVVGLDVRFDVLNLGYSFFIDPSEGHHVHQLGIGVASY